MISDLTQSQESLLLNADETEIRNRPQMGQQQSGNEKQQAGVDWLRRLESGSVGRKWF